MPFLILQQPSSGKEDLKIEYHTRSNPVYISL